MPENHRGWLRIGVRASAGSEPGPWPGTPAELLAAARILLYKYSGQREFAVTGAPPHSPWAALDPGQPWQGQLEALAGEPATGLSTGELAARLAASELGLELVFELVFELDPARYGPSVTALLPGHLDRILRLVAADPATCAREVDLLTGPERERLARFNDTRTEYPREATIHGLFAEHAGSQRPAVVHGGRAMSYRELDAASGRLAAVLRERGVRPDQPVGLLTGRTPEWVVATLAILRAGGAYLPLDPRYPVQRLDFLLRDSGAGVLVTTGEYAGLAERTGFRGAVVLADQEHGDAELGDRNGPEDVAYVMYTSGTTGRPKGVLVTHRNVVRLVRGARYVDLSADTRILQANAIAFDSSTFELWASLLNGGTLYLVGTDVLLDAAALGRAIAEHGITTLMLTPALFNQLADADPAVFRPLRHQFVGGDVLSPSHVNAVREACPQLRIINGYGPTENTTLSTSHAVRQRHDDRIPIGAPVSNSTAYVCDADGQPQPVGVPGELWVGGDGLARGYLNRPELTAAAFVRSPLDPGGRLYRTGDLARWRPDGTLDFLGRVDDQVKIRGFRIEPAEIEHRLRSHPEVRDAAVLVRARPATGEKYLCAYVATGVSGRELREFLGGELPDYLIPAYAVPLPELPYTPSGKLDRAALPEPAGAADADEYVAARTGAERALVRIWEATLGVSPVGVTDDIFDLGISSLAAAAMAAGIQREFGVQLPATDLLRHPTIEEVAGLLDAAAGAAGVAGPVVAVAAVPPDGRAGYRLSPQQHQLFVEQVKDPAAVHYNQPIVVDLPAGVDASRLASALAALVARHEQLRTAFEIGVPSSTTITGDGGTWRHTIARAVDAAAAEISVVDGPAPAVAQFVRPFDLAKPPLLRAALHRHGGRVRLLMDLHHVAADGVSLRVLFEELDALYAGRELPPLPPLRYVDYAEWTHGPDAARLLSAAEAYWLRVFETAPPPLELPTDAARPPVRQLAGATLEFGFGPARTAALRRLALGNGVTLFQLLLACYDVFLSRITGAHDFAVGTPVAGRTAPGLDSVVGMFVNTVCLRARPLPRLRFPEYLAEVRARVLGAFEHQDYPFDRLVASVAPERDYGRNPLFDTMFALQPAGLHDLRLLGRPVRLADDGLGQSMFDLNLHVFEHEHELRAVWGYATGLFVRETVAAFRDVLLATVDAIIADPDAPLGVLTGQAGVHGAPVVPSVRAGAAGAASAAEIDFDF